MKTSYMKHQTLTSRTSNVMLLFNKKVLISAFFLLFVFPSYSQILQSSCNSTDSLRNAMRIHADRLVVQRMNTPNSPYNDSVRIPSKKSDSAINWLVAIYNLQNIPERDTVINYLKQYYSQSIDLKEFVLGAKNSVPWMWELSSGTIPTGDSDIDSILINYNISFKDYLITSSYDFVLLESPVNININAICNKFNSISSVFSCEPNGFLADGGTITDTPFADHHMITFSYGWGDCMSGCAFIRYWQFNCYDSCRVEFKRSYGDNLTFVGMDNSIQKNEIYTFPNPFKNEISIKGITLPFEYTILTLLGQPIMKGISTNGKIMSLEDLPNGSYLLMITTKTDSYRSRIIKANE